MLVVAHKVMFTSKLRPAGLDDFGKLGFDMGKFVRQFSFTGRVSVVRGYRVTVREVTKKHYPVWTLLLSSIQTFPKCVF